MKERKYLLISTLPAGSEEAAALYNELKQCAENVELIETAELKISHCVGCNDCWIKTPGICRLKDDYEQVLLKMLQSTCVIFLTETRLGFVSAQMKNLVDRILPLATMHLRFDGKQMRHYSRYGVCPAMALIYMGEADGAYLSRWLERVQLNMHGRSLGAYKYNGGRELLNAIAGN